MPGTLRNVHWSPGQLIATFTAPGDDWYAGTVRSYAVRFNGGAVHYVAPTGPAGTVEHLAVPPGTQTVTVQAADENGNLSPTIDLGTSIAAAGGHATLVRASGLPSTGSRTALPTAAFVLLGSALAIRRRRLRH